MITRSRGGGVTDMYGGGWEQRGVPLSMIPLLEVAYSKFREEEEAAYRKFREEEEEDGVQLQAQGGAWSPRQEQVEAGRKRKRSSNWSEAETLQLLLLRRNQLQSRKDLKSCLKGSYAWDEIAAQLKEVFTPRSGKHVGERWDTLRRVYMDVEEHCSKTQETYSEVLDANRDLFKFVPTEYTQKWHELIADCRPGKRRGRKCNDDAGTTSPIQNAVSTPSLSNAVALSPLPNAVATSPLPKVVTTLPNDLTTSPVPSTVTTSPPPAPLPPEAVTTSPLPNAVTTSPLPNAVTTLPVPKVVTTSPLLSPLLPKAIMTSPVSNAVTTLPLPKALTTLPLPKLVTTSPLSTAVTTSPVPNAVTTSPSPKVVMSSPLPNAVTTSPLPKVATTSRLPSPLLPKAVTTSPLSKAVTTLPVSTAVTTSSLDALTTSPKAVTISPVPSPLPLIPVTTSPLPNAVTTSPLSKAATPSPVPNAVTTSNAVTTLPLLKAVTSSPLRNAVTTSPLPNTVTTLPLSIPVTTSPLAEAVTTSPLPKAVTTSPLLEAHVLSVTETSMEDYYNSLCEPAIEMCSDGTSSLDEGPADSAYVEVGQAETSPQPSGIAAAFNTLITDIEHILSCQKPGQVSDANVNVVSSLQSVLAALKSASEFTGSESYLLKVDKRELNLVERNVRAFSDRHKNNERPRVTRVETTFRKVVWPPFDPDPVIVTPDDVKSLEPGQQSSDNIVNFYLKYLHCKNTRIRDVQIFRPFTKNIAANLNAVKYGSVRKWMRSIFGKSYVLIPVFKDEQWSLLVICFPGRPLAEVQESRVVAPCILHINPSRQKTHLDLERHIRFILLMEWIWEYGGNVVPSKITDIPFHSVVVPLQENCDNAGLFILQYAELLLKKGPETFNLAQTTGFPFLSERFGSATTISMRRSIRQILLYLQNQEALQKRP